TSTPLTYRDYTGTRNGSLYGIAKDVNLGAAGRVSFRTRVPNLFLAGQSVNSHGILGVLMGSFVVCDNLLGSGVMYEGIRSSIL
ncbi:MAG: NAD(P)/FAD-dependent oxidoreductase, partial [Bacteroidaceae bacterium]|nr:NAD(P)/FAD-dependent oxidoreductase [Bacteroidaceae bacterium]